MVDDAVAFVGGINIIDDRNDLNHGRIEQPRLDFAVALRGPVVLQVQHLVQSLVARARLGHDWRSEVGALARSRQPVADTLQLLRELRSSPPPGALPAATLRPVRVAFVVRDNLRQRRAIERRYIEAMRTARHSVDIACPYFYPRRAFRRSLLAAARRGVRVRLLLQGKVDYRWRRWRRACCTTSCCRTACASTSTRPPSCTPRWRWSTTTGPRWAAPTSTRCRCCSTWRPTSWCSTRTSRS